MHYTTTSGCSYQCVHYHNGMTIYRTFFSGIILAFVSVSVVSADHAWTPYHWARTTNPFVLKIGDSVTAQWDTYLRAAAADWHASSVLDLSVVNGFNARNPKACRPKAGQGEVCNAKYGFTGWLGIAQIYASGDHITAGIVKMNDTYFSQPTYNTAAWRQLVMCQEVGHILGLDHQDESMTNTDLGTCMDYTNNPANNQRPNAHDYAMLETIYAHLDTATTLSQSVASRSQALGDDPREWGREIRRSRDGRAGLYERDLGGTKVFTHVFWVDDEDGRARDRAGEHAHTHTD